MKAPSLSKAMTCAVEACQAAGRIMHSHRHTAKKITSESRHDIKLELDVRCQSSIESLLKRAFPALPILGEEGVTGDMESDWRWVVDPIDGTVNFTHGIPHCCTTVALQRRIPGARNPKPAAQEETYRTELGVILDPFTDELWTARRGGAARLNGRVIHASQRNRLEQCLVGIGFAKETATLNRMMPVWNHLIPRVRKIRIMGAAALGLAYVASGRLDAYLEYGLCLWDVAAGGLLIECAGGTFYRHPLQEPHRYQIVASNAPLTRSLARFRE